MRSMTGFGRAVVERRGIRVVAELRALNQRFFELKMSLPRGWGEQEGQVRKMVQSVVARGRVEVFLRQATVEPPPIRLAVNERFARTYVAELSRLGKRLRLEGPLGFEIILHRPEIFHVVEDEEDYGRGIRLGFEALAKALRRLEAERRREGRSLRRDFKARLRKVEAAIPAIERLAERARAEVVAAFKSRVHQIVAELPLDEKRLHEEAVGAAQRGDIAEELTRLRIHLDALKDLVNRDEPAGKPIEFLLQEINREVNTIGAKSQNAALSHLAIALKGEAEKMREQAQNVE